MLQFIAGALAGALVVWGVGSVAPSLALDPRLAFTLAYAAVMVEIVGLARLAPDLRPRWAAPVVAQGVLGLVALANVRMTPASAAALTLVLGVAATLLGAAVGARIEKPAHLAAVGLVSAIADLWSVFDPDAPSAQLAERVLAEPEKLSPFALPFPLLGTPLIPAVIGAGDVVFAALYVAAFRAHGLSLRRLTIALSAAFAVGLITLQITLRPIPLLPLLAAAVLACEPAARALERKEWRAVLAVCALLLGGIALRAVRM